MPIITLLSDQDTFVWQAFPGSTHGDRSYILAGRGDSPNVAWALMRFPAHGMPPGSKINSATLRMYNYDTQEDWNASVSLGASGVSSTGWTPGGVTWNNRPAAAGTTTYRTVTGVNNGWLDWDVTALLGQMLSGTVNYSAGFYLIPNSPASGTMKGFRSRRSDMSLRPQLIIDYTPSQVKVNVGDIWRDSQQMLVNIGDAWKVVEQTLVNVGDAWKQTE